ncbi:putative C-type lectin domain family 20 member A isoform X1 [Myxocyprinus asiaticus]|uniref:putative C-type lectin domain family 20 member A isoform X1 n=1 Tax=Myxocyprinus asiaticus TaxID=70543 RepID=UPI0022215C23|nr:putative C-type lectin domain family 20 member A [Myxocyprinus asiaticus]XP_051501944.1 putative C-type lectin domain family 20 member A isoform X1 [Myxocyprinus asiaticus]XP_051501948.1 putative C-type lectin domain family 20 member A isoform X2 [Myxocyprinus asiaticus]XP_051501954.1 putative C-type lectin domain family 20 member A isoform X1 [Myxocyprinus asiaticus]
MTSDVLLVLLSVLSLCVSSRVFYYVSVPMNWTDAQKYCKQYNTDLATIYDQKDAMLIQTQTMDYTWIGLYRMNDNAPWMWSDQSTFNYSSWYGQPDQVGDFPICATTYPDGLWDDWPCGNVFPSVCYNDSLSVTTQVTGTTMPSTVMTQFTGTTSPSTEEKKTQRVRVQVKSRQNMNDPQVQKEILQKIEQILKQEGLPYDAKLSWKNQTDGNVFQKFQKREYTKQTCN